MIFEEGDNEEIQVRLEDIKGAMRREAYNCPYARAARRHFKITNEYLLFVDGQYCVIRNDDMRMYRLDPEAQNRVKVWDQSGVMEEHSTILTRVK